MNADPTTRTAPAPRTSDRAGRGMKLNHNQTVLGSGCVGRGRVNHLETPLRPRRPGTTQH